MSQTTARPTVKKRKPAGWVPDQHGAWVMVTVPLILGIFFAGPALIHLPLAVAWMCGYFAFFAATLWLKARGARKQRYVPALATYGVITAVAAAIVLFMRPSIIVFAAVFAPLVAVAVWETWRRRPRSLASGLATVLASCAMLPVTAWAAGDTLTPRLWMVTAGITLYFCGTIPYVKTLIRKRGDRAWFLGSIAYHALATAVMTVVVVLGYAPVAVIPVFVLLTGRAWWMPWEAGRRGQPWRPRTVGIGEALTTILVIVAVLLPL